MKKYLLLFTFLLASYSVFSQQAVISHEGGCNGEPVLFYDQSVNVTPTSWFWDFGDGYTSTVQNPSHQYQGAGTYTVSLTVYDSSSSYTASESVSILSCQPYADFSVSGTCMNDSITIYNGSTSGYLNVTSFHYVIDNQSHYYVPDPIHVFSTEGYHSIDLFIVNEAGDSAMTSKSIYFNDCSNTLVASFSNNGNCKNDTISFMDYSYGGNIISWNWEFGDGNSSSVQNPKHIYTSSGSYNVVLTISDGQYSKVASNWLYISNCALQASFGFSGNCMNQVVSFYDYSYAAPNKPIVSWSWDFNDGNTSSDQSPQHTFTAPGNYYVALTVTDNVGTSHTYAQYINITDCTPQLNASFWYNGSTCVNDTIHFADYSQPGLYPIVSWAWDFGDGTTSGLQHPGKVYTIDGGYNVTLTITDSSGASKSATNYINVNPCALQASFSISGYCMNQPVTFYDYSAPAPNKPITSWYWEFGDNSTSTLQNPQHIYASAGGFNVKLTVTDTTGNTSSTQQTVYISDCTPQLTASFYWNGNNCKNDTINFLDYSTPGNAPIISWAWDFGDGTNSSAQHPTKVFTNANSYYVTLTVTDSAGVSKTATNYVYVNSCELQASFSVYGSCMNQAVNFNDYSTAAPNKPIVSWFWDFGDSTSATGSNVQHTYTYAGSFTVILTVTDNSGATASSTQTVYVSDCTPQLSPYFNWSGGNCVNDSIYFNDYSSPGVAPIVAWSWNFGDSTTSALKNPVKVYSNAGSYPVMLTVTDSTGVSKSHTNYVNVSACTLQASFYYYGNCMGQATQFNDNSFPSPGKPIVSWIWDFGDSTTAAGPNPSHVYGYAGQFNVTLTVSDTAGQTDTYQKDIYINDCTPQLYANFYWNGSCVYDSISFIDNSTPGISPIVSWAWNFGDSTTSTVQFPHHKYSAAGSYQVTLVVTDSLGNTATANYWPTISNCQLEANFYHYGNCANQQVSFYSNSTPAPDAQLTGFDWFFGDSTTISGQSVAHVFTSPGTYEVRLVVTQSNGDTAHAVQMINIMDCTQGLVASFSHYGQCADQPVNFWDNSYGGQVNTWHWNFGDGTTSSIKDPMHIYSAPGTYTVMLTVSDSGSSTDTTYKIITISPCGNNLNPSFNYSGYCVTDSFMFTNASSPDSAIVAWHWNFGDGTTSTLKNPSHQYSAPGTYGVILMVYTATGDSSSTYQNVNVVDCAQPCYLSPGNNPTTVCSGSPVTLSVSLSDVNGSIYWSTGETGPAMTDHPTQTSTYIVTGYCSGGGSDTIAIIVNVTPAFIATVSATNATCGSFDGSATVFVDSAAIQPVTYSWSNGTILQTASNLMAGNYEVAVTDAMGCQVISSTFIYNIDGPTISGISATNTSCPSVCDAAATVYVSGGTNLTYTWSNGVKSSSISGLCPGTYSVNVVDGGCTVSSSVVVESDASDPIIAGMIDIGGSPVNSGIVELYQMTAQGAYAMIAQASITQGNYSFNSVPAGNYIVAAIADTAMYPYSVTTYYNGQFQWANADVVIGSCGGNQSVDISVIDLTPLNGPGTISGYVKDVTGRAMVSDILAPGDPIPGVDVSLEQNPGGIIIAQTQTDMQGAFTFEKVPEGSYTIYVDVPGLDMTGTYNVAIDQNNLSSGNNNFFVDSSSTITIIDPLSVKKNNKVETGDVKVYPNPFSTTTYVSYAIIAETTVDVVVYNVLGEKVAVVDSGKRSAGKYIAPVSSANLNMSAGVYFIKVRTGETEQTFRVILSQ